MYGSTLLMFAAESVEELAEAQLEHPFGSGWEEFKVRGKVLRMTRVPGQPGVIVEPELGEARALRATHTDVIPGYRMNNERWATLEADDSIAKKLANEPYRPVAGNLPRSNQPVDPETSGISGWAAQ